MKNEDDPEGTESVFETIYKVKFVEPTLRELLVLSSLYLCKTLSDIIDIVDDQPKPLIFFKSLLELNGTNMTSVLSFDSRSMKFLLDAEAFSEYFDPQYPMFYKNKFFKNKNPRREKLFYRSAFDNALKNNQTGAIKHMIDYIVQY